MRISNYGINYNDYAANNEILKENENPFQYTQNSGTKKAANQNSILNNSAKSKEFQALAKLLTATAKNASDTRDTLEKLSATGKDSLFAKAKEKGSVTEVVNEVKNFISQYNEMISGMKEIGGTENTAYLKELDQYFKDNEEALKAVGITQDKDGKLLVDEKVIKEATPESLEKLFSGSASFGSKISIKSIYIEANLVKSQQTNDILEDLNSYSNYSQKSQRINQPYRYYLK